MRVHSHYENLKVSRDAPPAVIRAAYRTLTQQYHPDRNPDDPRAQRVMGMLNRAYEVLSDPERRKAHDAWIRQEEATLLYQHDESVRRDALRRQEMTPPPAQSPSGLSFYSWAGITVVVLVLAAVILWAVGSAATSAPTQRTAAVAS